MDYIIFYSRYAHYNAYSYSEIYFQKTENTEAKHVCMFSKTNVLCFRGNGRKLFVAKLKKEDNFWLGSTLSDYYVIFPTLNMLSNIDFPLKWISLNKHGLNKIHILVRITGKNISSFLIKK